MPSDLDFKTRPNEVNNPEGDMDFNKEKDERIIENNSVQTFSFKGKGIFSMDSLYQRGELVDKQFETFSVKSLNEEKSEEFRVKNLWERFIGYGKR